ncbi:MAG TPA: DmsC/YnfH family molybdoenzyme membrane anchor subunit, partial [Planctomycetaceae bacterium]|nr:DmsC/YnfH family molybdoenzyme membrane anchor subunit [Planctomycetaceae bacterium]
KACVTACHAMNGLDDHETWREVGLLVGGSYRLPVLQHVTTACHHCVEPGCMSACPTLAYEKDAVTGIVKHLDDQCFGCQYCVLACPYEVPKYHAEKGIVRKCDMCSSRLKAGEAPACVQACPHEAIRISLVNIAEVRAASATSAVLPTAPASRFTLPTTRYSTERVAASMLRAGDEEDVVPEHNHVPLMAMLVLSQIAVGLMLAAIFSESSVRLGLVIAGFVLGLLAIVAATSHLGRPWLAYRAVLGWRTSWLSREIIAFGVFQAMCSAAVAVTTFAVVGESTMQWIIGATTLTGLIGVYCSVMIYAVTPRTFWARPYTTVKFFGTTFFTAALVWLLLGPGATPAAIGMASLALMKLIAESRQRHAPGEDRWAERSSRLLYGPLRQAWFFRAGSMLLCGVLGPMVLVAAPLSLPLLSIAITVGSLISELVERSLFFRAAAAPRMPGGVVA